MRPIHARDFLIPVAIVLAGIILAGAIYVVRLRHNLAHGTGDPAMVHPVSPADHLIGNPAAPVAIIEYGDVDGAYTKSLERTMEQLMTEYGSGNKVVWVYRHFPVTTEHPNAATNALAAECAASLSTPSTFFRFMDTMQTAAPDQNQFDPKGYPALLSGFGIDATAFTACMTKGAFGKKIHDDYDNALASGATGAPFVILLVHGEKPVPINGELPYAAMKQLIDQAIAKTS